MSQRCTATFRRRLACLLALGALLSLTPAAWSKPTRSAPSSQKTSSQKPLSSAGQLVHEVRPGQTLGGIALGYKVTVAALCRANAISRQRPIRVGQRLVIPGATATPKAQPKTVVARPAPPAASQSPASTDSTAATKNPKDEPAPKESWLAYTRPAPQAGYVKLHSTIGAWSGYAIFKGDVLSPYARSGFRRVLASWRTGKQIDIPERLIRVLVKVSDTFGGRPLRIVGGYREHSYAKASKHKLGHAVDFSVDGVPNEALRDFLRTLPDVGVGYYPNSSFVHLDVRPKRAYWIDYSQPGKPPVYPGDLRAAARVREAPYATTPDVGLTAQIALSVKD